MTNDQAHHDDEQDDRDDARQARREAAIRRLGSRDPRCPCGQAEPLALTGRHPQIRCYECQAVAAGRSWIEQQHRPVTKAMRQAVYERDGGACVDCGSKFDLQYDHIIPVALGGGTSIDNLQLLCQDCNLEKRASI